MILDHWWDSCAHHHIVPRERPPLVSTMKSYPHCPLFVRKFKEQVIGELGPLLRKMRITWDLDVNHQR